MTRHRHALKPFSRLSRSKRADIVMAVKNQVRDDRARLGGRFTSDLVLDEPGRPAVYQQSFHFGFPSARDRFTAWNANIFTANEVFWDRVRDLAHQRVEAALVAAGIERVLTMDFTPVSWSSTGKVTGYVWNRPDPAYDIFEGRTYREETERLEAVIVREAPPEVHEHFRIDRKYEWGVGLEIVVDAESIDRAVIEAAIDRFQAMGEIEWMAPEPVPRDLLPKLSASEAYRQARDSMAAEAA